MSNARTMDPSPLTLIAPVGGVTTGQFYQSGEVRGFVIEGADAGEPFALETACRNKDAPKVTGVAWAEGAALYYDSDAEGFTDVATANTGPVVAKALAAAVNADETCDLVLRPDALSTDDDDSQFAKTADLASTDEDKGASMIAIEDNDDLFTAANVEEALAEVKTIADDAVPATDLAAATEGKGAAMVGYADGTVADLLDSICEGTAEDDGAGNLAIGAAIPNLTATTTIRAALIELVTRVKALEDA